MVFGKKRKAVNLPESAAISENPASAAPVDKNEILKESLLKALHTFAYISPVKSLDPLREGDVMVSASGNMRLVTSLTNKTQGTAVATFLTHQAKNNLRIESALLKRIDQTRLEAIIVRRATNPLGQFQEIARCLGKESDIFDNVAVLLRTGVLGRELAVKLKSDPVEQKASHVTLYISMLDGRIEGVEGKPVGKQVLPLNLLLNNSYLPTDEYVLKMQLPEQLNDGLKRRIIAASVFANSIQNARNLTNLVRRIEGKESFLA